MPDADTALAARLAGTAMLTLQRLRYPLVARHDGASGGDRAIVGDVCLGFPQTLQVVRWAAPDRTGRGPVG